MVFKVWKLFYNEWTTFFGASAMLRFWVLFWVEMFSKGVERSWKSSFFWILFWLGYLNLSASRFNWNGIERPDFFKLLAGECAIDYLSFGLAEMIVYCWLLRFVSAAASSVLFRPGTPWNWNSLLRVLTSWVYVFKPLWVNECVTATGNSESVFAD